MNANRSRYLPPSEAEDEEATAEMPEETLVETEARADRLHEIYRQQSEAAQKYIGIVIKRIGCRFPLTRETAITLETCIQSMNQTHKLYQMVQKELRVKRDEELRAVREKAGK